MADTHPHAPTRTPGAPAHGDRAVTDRPAAPDDRTRRG
jgi:hypothetical protein